MTNNQQIEFEKSSGNIFADLGLDGAEELFIRAKIGFYVYQIIKQRNLKPKEIATLFGITQSQVSHLMNGHFSRFTTDQLLDFLKGLKMKVTI
jgi:predicted XRE-type DNA-binding protein